MSSIRNGKLTMEGFLREANTKLKGYKMRNREVWFIVYFTENNNPVDSSIQSLRGSIRILSNNLSNHTIVPFIIPPFFSPHCIVRDPRISAKTWPTVFLLKHCISQWPINLSSKGVSFEEAKTYRATHTFLMAVNFG